MKYKVGDKIKIKSWDELINDYQITHYNFIKTEAINLPDGMDFSKEQYRKIINSCENRIDIIEKVNEDRGWYYLKNSKTIITKHVIKNKVSEVINVIEPINNRFEILDL